jgi:hypothetical protein
VTWSIVAIPGRYLAVGYGARVAEAERVAEEEVGPELPSKA